tara:strand:+ start:355 stop:3042 length:2688 start_codon:yes stop_codon:yes gene_type:complete
MYENAMNTDSGLGMIFAMLWVFLLMGAVMTAFITQRLEETMRMRVGLEIEVLRNDHTENAPNHSIATWLDMKAAAEGDAYNQAYEKTRKKRVSMYRKTRAKRREAIHKALPHSYYNRRFRVRDESWSQGRTAPHTKVIPDGSLSSGGFEVVSHPLTDGAHHGWIATLGRLLRHITRIDRSCGLHVHIGLRDPDANFGDGGQLTMTDAKSIAGRVAWAYAYFTDAFNQIVSPSRHSGQYCQRSYHMLRTHPNPTNHTTRRRDTHVMDNPSQEAYILDGTHEYEQLYDNDPSEGYVIYRVEKLEGQTLWHKMYDNARSHGRYYHLNVCSLLDRPFGTVEFRQHQGTSNPVKMSNWVDLCYEFVLRCASVENFNGIQAYSQDLKGLWAFLDYAEDDPVVDYYTKRAYVLNGGNFIRDCDNCGSNTCVHYECVTKLDSDISDDAKRFFANSRDWSCYDCGSSNYLSEINTEYETAHCEYCDNEVSIHCSGAIASLALGLFVAAPLVGAVALVVGCGIGAIHVGAKKFQSKKNFKRLFNDLAVRGGQASGFAWQKSKGGLWYIKSPTPSTHLKKRVDDLVKGDTIWIMGHTRFATHGENNSDNAHPHWSPDGHITLIHNGVVGNYDKVWKTLGLKPTGPVDSQAVAAALEVGGIEKVVELCVGNMSLIWSDNRDPKGTLKFWTNGGNPLCAGRLHHPNKGPLVIASTLPILKQSQKGLKTHWSCTIGTEYTVHPDGSIEKRDIEGSEDSVGVGMYNWRTYASLYGGKSKSNKTRTITVNAPTGKADGVADNCTLPDVSDSYEYDDMVLNDVLNDVWAQMSIDGWIPIDEYHGYDTQTHVGVRPDGTSYKLPNYYGGKAMDPVMDTDQMVMVLRGEFDPRTTTKGFNEVESYWNDVQEYYN